MFRTINAKIIVRTPIADLRVRRRLQAAAFLIYTLSVPAGISLARPALDRSAFSKINFTGPCAQKQWALMPDNSLKLILTPGQTSENAVSGQTVPQDGTQAPAPEIPCQATLEFYFPQEVSPRSVITFEARSTRPGTFIQMGVQEQPGSPLLFSPALPRHGLTTEWKQGEVLLNRLKAGWFPSRISSLHISAVPNPGDPSSEGATVMVRFIRIAVQPPVQAPVVNKPLPAAPSVTWKPSTLFHSAAVKILFALAVLALVVLTFTSRSKRKRILSPLYEINARMWKTHRDEAGVVQFGGLKKIALSDLKAIKQAGFNALWVMGIWEVGPKVRDISKSYAEDFHGSPFAIFDYAVSSDLGTEQDFRELVQRAHTQRLSVIVDFIPNHMGLDCAWLNDHPEYFIHRVLDTSESTLTDDELKQKYPGYFPYRTPSYPDGDRRVPRTLMVAYGKDPYFYPWIDTAQLDYANPGLRQKMIDLLCYWARTVDGIRCDMAMLVLRDQIKIHRHPDMSWDTFNRLMPGEFWTEAIQAVKRVNPNFVFMAETYWSMEGALQKLGFDYTYNKPLYEAICSAVHSGHAEGLMNFLRILGTDFLKRSVHFLENHDEERAMNALGEDRQRAAATMLCTLPGIALLHQGQMEGKRERLPVQRVISLHDEPEHQGLRHFYRKLLKATSLPVFQEGRLTPLYSNNTAFASYSRIDSESKALVIINTSDKTQKGSVFLMPGLQLDKDTPYHLDDLFYEFKNTAAGTVQPYYVYPAAKLINQGLYVELEPYDSHIFVVEPQGALHSTQRMLGSVRDAIEEWPLNRVVRQFLGAAFTRSSDTHLAANPAGRQQ